MLARRTRGSGRHSRARDECCGPSAPLPPLRLTRVDRDVSRLWRYTSSSLFLSGVPRFDAVDANATKRPSALMDGWKLEPLGLWPSAARLTSLVVARCDVMNADM